MKILCFTDTHGNKKAMNALKLAYDKEKPDIVLCAGDFTSFQQDTEEILDKIKQLSPVFLIHGNHEDEDSIAKLCKERGIHYAHKKVFHYKDCTIIGYGGGGFAQRDEEFERFWKKVKIREKGILITHQPPLGTQLDKANGDHVGNKSYLLALKDPKLKLFICGHMHENVQVAQEINGKLVMNPGPGGAIIDV